MTDSTRKSAVREYHELFTGTNPAVDFAETIKDAILYIIAASDARYSLKRTDITPPLDLTEMPGKEFGFKPMEVCVAERTSRRKDPETGERMPRKLMYAELLSGRHVKFVDPRANLPDPETEVFALFRPWPDGPGVNNPSGYVPILYNDIFGEVYYVSASKVRVGKAGRVRLECNCSMPILAVNWITGQKTVIGHPGYFSYHYTWLMPDFVKAPHTYFSPEELAARREEFFHTDDLYAMSLEDAMKLGLPEGVPPEWRGRLMSREQFKKYLTPPTPCGCLGPFLGPFALYGLLEKLYDLPRCALWQITAQRSMVTKTPMDEYYNLLTAFGNLFQLALQTWDKSTWFIPTLLSSLNPGKKCVRPGVTNLHSLLDINRPTLKKFLAMPTEEPFILYMMMNRHKPTGMEEFERVYENLHKSSIKAEHLNRCYSRADVKLRSGRILFSTNNLPHGLGYYSKQRLDKVISIPHYYKWLRQEVALYEKTKTPPKYSSCLNEVLNLLTDYNRMAKELFSNLPFTFPHNIVKAHDVMVENFNRVSADKIITSEIGGEEYRRFAQCYARKRCDIYSDDKYMVTAPTCSLDLYEEGIILNHCVGAYGKDIMAARGSMLIYFLRSVKAPETPLVTIQVNRDPGKPSYSFFEVAGKGNRLPNDAEKAFCDRWLVAFNKAFADALKAKVEPAIAYDPEVMLWVKLQDISTDVLPAFQAAISMERNYQRLWSTVLTILHDRSKESGAPLDVTGIQDTLSGFCKKLGLNSSILDKLVYDTFFKAA